MARHLRDITHTPLSPQTVRGHLKEAGPKAVVRKNKPLLTPRHRRNRLGYAIAHQDWTVEDRKRVIFSCETKTNRLGSDGRKQAQKLPGEGLTSRLIQGMLKFGGGLLMVWGCTTKAGVRNCCRMDGRMDGDLCTAILDEYVVDGISYFDKAPSDTVYQQDNDPKHTCKKAKEWFKNHQIKLMS